MSFLYYILSLEKQIKSKLDNKKEPSILILFAMKIDDKINLIMSIWYYIAMKIELEMNLVLVNEPCIYGGKIDVKINLLLIK